MYGNILDLVGNTPLVRINKMNPKPGKVEIYAKLEGMNPTGSIKDRIALNMIAEAEKNGKLTHDKIIIEPTSGNTGIGLAMVAIAKGYHCLIVMSAAVSVERQRILKAFGADILLTDPTKGTDGAIIKAREMVAAEPDKYYMPDQFSNKFNYLAHYEKTADEIYSQVDGKIDYFVSSIGTSGTIMGVGTHLKEKLPDIKIVCAHPIKGHYIQGLKNMTEAIIPALYDPSKIDITEMIESEEAFDIARRLVREEGIFAGMSRYVRYDDDGDDSGAALLAALRVAERIDSGRIVVIFPDRGEKYLSTSLFVPPEPKPASPSPPADK